MNIADERPDLLETIVEATRRAVADRRESRSVAEVERAAAGRAPRGDAFRAALRHETRYNVIAECKRRSPSRGVLCAEYRPVAVAEGYAEAGAAAVSVLTEPAFFDGSLEHLEAVRAAVAVPVLRKDFIVTEYQLLEARAAGADAVLLIVAALGDPELGGLLATASDLALAVLVEVHDRGELDRALAAGAGVVGVNNRNLRTLEVDIEASHALVGVIPANVIAVVESGLRAAVDLTELRRAGYEAFLIGESLMTQPDPGAALGRLLAAIDPTPLGARRAGRGAVCRW